MGLGLLTLSSLCHQHKPRPFASERRHWSYCLARGARIHSDSWTSSDGAAYNVHSAEVDDFAWLFQDFLPVFAAGNYGTNLYDGTICAPATAKNCLAVGETLDLR